MGGTFGPGVGLLLAYVAVDVLEVDRSASCHPVVNVCDNPFEGGSVGVFHLSCCTPFAVVFHQGNGSLRVCNSQQVVFDGGVV